MSKLFEPFEAKGLTFKNRIVHVPTTMNMSDPQGYATRRLAAATLAAQTAEELAHLACKMMSAATSMAPQRVAELQLEPWPVATVSAKD